MVPFDFTKPLTRRSARSVAKILEAAAALFGREGYQAASMLDVARAAGVSKGLLHYHFSSKEHLLIEAQRATFRQIHRRVQDRFARGDRGLKTALEGLDMLWGAVREMRAWAPFMVETLSLAAQQEPIRAQVDTFYDESMDLLERSLEEAFSEDLDRLSLPPERTAQMIRVVLHGLMIDLALAKGPEDLARIDQTYRDLRETFSKVALSETGKVDNLEEGP
jgi:AcrR family transcriptional regulator